MMEETDEAEPLARPSPGAPARGEEPRAPPAAGDGAEGMAEALSPTVAVSLAAPPEPCESVLRLAPGGCAVSAVSPAPGEGEGDTVRRWAEGALRWAQTLRLPHVLGGTPCELGGVRSVALSTAHLPLYRALDEIEQLRGSGALRVGIAQIATAFDALGKCGLVPLSVTVTSVWVCRETLDWTIAGLESLAAVEGAGAPHAAPAAAAVLTGHRFAAPLPQLATAGLGPCRLACPHDGEALSAAALSSPLTVFDAFRHAAVSCSFFVAQLFWYLAEDDEAVPPPGEAARLGNWLGTALCPVPKALRGHLRSLLRHPGCEIDLYARLVDACGWFRGSGMMAVLGRPERYIIAERRERRELCRRLCLAVPLLSDPRKRRLAQALRDAVSSHPYDAALVEPLLRLQRWGASRGEAPDSAVRLLYRSAFAEQCPEAEQLTFATALLEGMQHYADRLRPDDLSVARLVWRGVREWSVLESTALRDACVRAAGGLFDALGVAGMRQVAPPAEVTALCRRLQNDDDAGIRRHTVVLMRMLLLGGFWAEGREVLSELLPRNLKDPSTRVRESALAAAAACAPLCPESDCAQRVLPLVFPLLVDTDQGVRDCARHAAAELLARPQAICAADNNWNHTRGVQGVAYHYGARSAGAVGQLIRAVVPAPVRNVAARASAAVLPVRAEGQGAEEMVDAVFAQAAPMQFTPTARYGADEEAAAQGPDTERPVHPPPRPGRRRRGVQGAASAAGRRAEAKEQLRARGLLPPAAPEEPARQQAGAADDRSAPPAGLFDFVEQTEGGQPHAAAPRLDSAPVPRVAEGAGEGPAPAAAALSAPARSSPGAALPGAEQQQQQQQQRRGRRIVGGSSAAEREAAKEAAKRKVLEAAQCAAAAAAGAPPAKPKKPKKDRKEQRKGPVAVP
eukprot:TRINITY_DN10852_c0_g2_i1.p1 TRINITY_DN10852_c0_g2~~TRINITY_DN10852_c0_g2_i1.p1  ORF type:complete len:935 (+),score=340.41 TRINITY_DN10852_c0_g2_i1:83-2806(+)